MIDSHCHLQFEQFDKDREEIISEIEEQLDLAAIAGTNIEDNKEARKIAETSDTLIYCEGSHPLFDHSSLKEIKEQIREDNPAAVGEIGLDYNYITDEKGL